ncbi:cytochrome c biogenesis protein [Conexibacter sp. DBS9H8]|uniref:cytochrome c biogenesis protein n=1 Tax=Conexibacter sp. DBS9H8 TaxID=2937801 RepID=UPI0020104BF8|nr:cytochrome c biogenesis protein CcsA [Conexibacter sp. DBS9H8]
MSPHVKHLRPLTIATLITFVAGLSLTFFYAPIELNEGFVQKIFYIHVPLAIVSLCGYVLGGIFGLMYLRTGKRVWDMRSYCAIHMALIFSIGGIVAGSIWAKAAWGHWWVWSEPTLVSYLIVILLFCTYQPLRFSIEDPERQATYAAVFAVVGGAFVPLNFIVVRLSVQYLHPRVFNLEGGNLPGSMALTFYVMLLAVALLFATLMKYEMLAKETRGQTRRLRRRLLGDENVAPIGRSAAPL